MKRWSFLIVAFLLVLSVVTAALAEGEGDPGNADAAKTVIVNAGAAEESAEFKTIQAAIDSIAGKEDKTGWIISVKNGEYDRFTVPKGISALTIQGESRDGVVVKTLMNTERASQWDNGGINIHGSNVTLKTMTVLAGSSTVAWADAAISTHHGASGGKGVSLTVEGCTVTGENAKYGIFWDCDRVEVMNCTISGFSNAIEYMCDNFSIPAGETYKMTGNTIMGCGFAIHGYMGGGEGGGVLEISGNTVSGTDALRTKVIVQQNAANTLKADIKNNRFENVVIGLVNLRGEGETVSEPLEANTLGKNCFYVEAIEPGTIDFYSTYRAPQSGNGHWELTGIDDFEVDWGKNPDGTKAYIEDVVAKANAAGSKTLSLTGIDENNLIKTFTWFKDGIYWVTDPDEPMPTPEPTPGPTGSGSTIIAGTPTPAPIPLDPPTTGDEGGFGLYLAAVAGAALLMLALVSRKKEG